MKEAGRVVVLLGPQGAGKTDALLALARLVSSTAIDGRLKSLVDDPRSISVCTSQRLLHGHLTVRENVWFMAALHGVLGRERVDELLRSSSLAAHSDQPVYTLPRHLSRVLNLVWALLPEADVLLIDDLTRGLSMPAQRQLCRFILEEGRRRSRTILFATRELHVAQALAGEVWLFEHGQVLQQWQPGELPGDVFQAAAYQIELKNAMAARAFCDTLATQSDYVRDVQSLDLCTVRVVVDQASSLLNLVQIAGQNSLNFQSLPLEADYLLTQWPAAGGENLRATQEPRVPSRHSQPSFSLPRIESWQRAWRAVMQLALVEWRTHFRRFWRAGNILLSGLVFLITLQYFVYAFGLERLAIWAPLILLISSSLALGFAPESTVRLTIEAEAETLFQPARAVSASSRLSRLALYDLTPIGRGGVWLGLFFGQGLILLCHAVIPLVCWTIILIVIGQGRELMIASFIFWLLTAIDSLALAVWVSQLVHRPGWSVGLGWLLWLLVTLTAVAASPDHPLAWLWPYFGFTAAFRFLFAHPILALAPFGMALLGTVVLCVLSLQTFRQRRAVYAP